MKRIIVIWLALGLALAVGVAQAAGVMTKTTIGRGNLAGLVPLENGDVVMVMNDAGHRTIDVIYLRDGAVYDSRSLAWDDPGSAPRVEVHGCERTIHLVITEADETIWYSHYDLPAEQRIYLPVVCKTSP